MRTALIDLGTNSVRLHIFERDLTGALKRVFQRKEMIQLGEGLFQSGDFTAEAKVRALDTFREFSHDLKRFNTSQTLAVGTCAMREAKSGAKLREEIEQTTGVSLQIISGREEAELIAAGILTALGPFPESTLLIDIGGGSTEISYVRGTKVAHAASTAIGAVRCQEMTLQEEIPPSPANVEKLRTLVRSELHTHIPEQFREDCRKIIGSSGSIRAIIRLIRGAMSKETPTCSLTELHEFTESIQKESLDELRSRPSLESKRAKIIVAAAIILHQIAETLGVQEIEAVPLGLKDGLKVKISSSS